MHDSRFVFLAMPPRDGQSLDSSQREANGGVVWMLVSPNNRPLGRGSTTFETYADCLDAVHRLRQRHDRLKPTASTVEATGKWAWRIDLDGDTVAVSSRAYLRVRECHYNLDRFVEALPKASIVAGTRVVRKPGRAAQSTQATSSAFRPA